GRMAERAFFQASVETMPRAGLESLKAERLLELVPHVYERSGLIREAWDAAGVHPCDIRFREEFFERAPLTSKGRCARGMSSSTATVGGRGVYRPGGLSGRGIDVGHDRRPDASLRAVVGVGAVLAGRRPLL